MRLDFIKTPNLGGKIVTELIVYIEKMGPPVFGAKRGCGSKTENSTGLSLIIDRGGSNREKFSF